MAASLENISHVGILSVAYLALVATIVGYVLWGRLLARHPASKVAPLSLSVPMLGLISSAWFLDEQLAAVQWLGGLVVMFGLAVNVFGQRLLRGLRSEEHTSELQSLMRISYAVFCLKKKNTTHRINSE